MARTLVGFSLLVLFAAIGCGGNSDSTGDDANNSTNGSTTAASNDTDDSSSDESNPNASADTGDDNNSANNETANNPSSGDDTANNETADDNSTSESTTNESSTADRSNNSSDSTGLFSDSNTEADDAADVSDDPIMAIVDKIGNPQLSAAYPQIKKAASAESAGAAELYTEVNLLQSIGFAMLQENNRDDALIAFGASYEKAKEAEERLGAPPQEAFELLANVYYNGACVESLTGNIDEAHTALDKSIALGFNDAELLKTDSDLDALREREGFEADLEKWLKAIEGDE